VVCAPSQRRSVRQPQLLRPRLNSAASALNQPGVSAPSLVAVSDLELCRCSKPATDKNLPTHHLISVLVFCLRAKVKHCQFRPSAASVAVYCAAVRKPVAISIFIPPTTLNLFCYSPPERRRSGAQRRHLAGVCWPPHREIRAPRDQHSSTSKGDVTPGMQGSFVGQMASAKTVVRLIARQPLD
jgi:hypothetical protein